MSAGGTAVSACALTPVGVLHDSARSETSGSTSGDACRRLGVDAGGERRVLFEDAYVVLRVPITTSRGSVDAPVGSQPFIRRSPHMMRFGHVPTGSIRNDGHTWVGGHGVSPSTRRSVAETQAAVSRHRTSPSRSA